jgi:hypothetical protein
MRSFATPTLLAIALTLTAQAPAQDVTSAAPKPASAPSTEQPPKSKDPETDHRTAREAKRICALHGAERAAELRKLKKKSGLDLYCPND